MARRVFLHVGTPKSGTSYLQALWWRNRDSLAARGLLVPGRRLRDHFHAASLVHGRTEVVERLGARQRGVWDRLLAETGQWSGDALISHELFSPTSAGRAREALHRLGDSAEEVHVVVTLRDLARQLRSDWQQNVKQGRADTLTQFWDRVREDPSDEWWLFQDVPALLDRWTSGVPADRTHLVVLPPPGAPDTGWLWRAACELTGVDPDGLDAGPDLRNASLGVVEVETMRRVQDAVPVAERGLDMRRLTKDYFAERVLTPAGSGEGFALPPELHAWARERGRAMLEDLRGRGLHVVGDLDHLDPGPAPPPGRTPDDVSDAEVAEVAVNALALMLVHERRRRSG